MEIGTPPLFDGDIPYIELPTTKDEMYNVLLKTLEMIINEELAIYYSDDEEKIKNIIDKAKKL